MAQGDTRERARVIGDPARTVVLLPAGPGNPARPLIAKTCKECGELRNAADFPTVGKRLNPRCRNCLNVRNRGYDGRRRAPSHRAHQFRQQAVTLETATHHREPWTGPQLEIALREDLTAIQAAKMLGRSHYAVETIRRRARKDPRIEKLAGIRPLRTSRR